MAKTDKELTVDIVCEYIRAWGTQTNCVPVKSHDLDQLIRMVYRTVSTLEGPPPPYPQQYPGQ